ARDIVYSSLFTGVLGNYLRGSIVAAGLDPEHLPAGDPSQMDFAAAIGGAKAWKDIWGCGQGIGAVREVLPARALVQRLQAEYQAARARLCGA
ncbi:MAG: nitronate monooxygenase, partial [Betaproteobacteria bacterium]|nr:nitronate monooxygenase [Betaproteobacteria bacterium]